MVTLQHTTVPSGLEYRGYGRFAPRYDRRRWRGVESSQAQVVKGRGTVGGSAQYHRMMMPRYHSHLRAKFRRISFEKLIDGEHEFMSKIKGEENSEKSVESLTS
jgi:hypothetical protein